MNEETLLFILRHIARTGDSTDAPRAQAYADQLVAEAQAIVAEQHPPEPDEPVVEDVKVSKHALKTARTMSKL